MQPARLVSDTLRIFEYLNQTHWFALFTTIVLLFATVTAGRAIARRIRTQPGTLDAKRSQLVAARNVLALAFFVSFLAIWGGELKTFALSLAAILAASIVAAKEALLSTIGGLVMAVSRRVRVGDIVEINGFRGEVIDRGLFSTTLLESGVTHHFTGRLIHFPNSYYLVNPVVNHSHTGQWRVAMLTIPMSVGYDILAAEKLLKQVADERCAHIIREAKTHLARLADKHFIGLPSAEPKVAFHVKDEKRIDLVLRYPSPRDGHATLEQEILRQFLAGLELLRRPAGPKSASD